MRGRSRDCFGQATIPKEPPPPAHLRDRGEDSNKAAHEERDAGADKHTPVPEVGRPAAVQVAHAKVDPRVRRDKATKLKIEKDAFHILQMETKHFIQHYFQQLISDTRAILTWTIN